MPRRTATGTDYNRVNLLMAVLEKRIGLHLGNCDASSILRGGIRMNEPAIDLGIVMAIVSSYKNRPIDEKMIVFGEVGLSGEVRAVNMPEQRVAEAKKLGFETCVVPEVSLDMVKGIRGIKVIGVKNISDAMNRFKIQWVKNSSENVEKFRIGYYKYFYNKVTLYRKRDEYEIFKQQKNSVGNLYCRLSGSSHQFAFPAGSDTDAFFQMELRMISAERSRFSCFRCWKFLLHG